MDHEIARDHLLSTDEEFRKLHQEHQDCEGRLETLLEQMSSEAEIEIKRIKLHKLALKDRMESMVRAHLEQGVPTAP